MAVLIDRLTLGEIEVISLDVDPRTGGGYATSIGSMALLNNSGTPVGQIYVKTGAGNTAWELVSTTASAGSIASGAAGNLALYPASGNSISDTYSQNSQAIKINVVPQASRSAAITYNVPNPGNAITSADFVLTQGAQTIAGAKTFSNDVTINANLSVVGTLTYINTTNLQISDPLITLNKGGAAASGGGGGIEVEENAAITAYFKQASTRNGWDFLSSSSAFVATLLQSSMTASRSYTLPDVSTVLAGKSGTPTAGHAAFWTDSNQVAAEQFLNVSRGGTGLSGASAANGTLLIGNGSGYTLATLSQGANQGVTIVNASGSITLSTVQDLRVSASPTHVGMTLSGLGLGVVHSSAGGVLSSSAVVLTSEVSGILPIANGGTNASTALNNNRLMISSSGSIVEHSALTQGQVMYPSATGLPAGSANLFWDITNSRLGVGINAPAVNLHSAGSFRISGSASQFQLIDASDYRIYQTTVNTTTATVTALSTIATTTDTSMLLEVRVAARRTGGSAGTAGDGASYIRTARVKNVGGTVTISNLQSDYTSEDQNGWNATFAVSGTNILVNVTGAANNNIQWQATVIQMVN